MALILFSAITFIERNVQGESARCTPSCRFLHYLQFRTHFSALASTMMGVSTRAPSRYLAGKHKTPAIARI